MVNGTPDARPGKRLVTRAALNATLAGLLTGFASLAGCDTFKKIDTEAALLATFNVDTVKHAGRQHIRLHGKRAVALIDPVGAQIVEYRRHAGSGPFYAPPPELPDVPADPTDEPSENITPPLELFPNVLAAGGWRVSIESPAVDLSDRRFWVTDASVKKLVLLSDTRRGLACEVTLFLHDAGPLDIAVKIVNSKAKVVDVTVASQLDMNVEKISAEVRSSQAHVGGNGDATGQTIPAEHYRLGDQWFSRIRPAGPPGTPGQAFRFARTIPGFGSLSWSERWWITPVRRSEQAPAPPRLNLPFGGSIDADR